MHKCLDAQFVQSFYSPAAPIRIRIQVTASQNEIRTCAYNQLFTCIFLGDDRNLLEFLLHRRIARTVKGGNADHFVSQAQLDQQFSSSLGIGYHFRGRLVEDL
ncbi:hypothetical protein D3C75_1032420 [compost metagenome]